MFSSEVNTTVNTDHFIYQKLIPRVLIDFFSCLYKFFKYLKPFLTRCNRIMYTNTINTYRKKIDPVLVLPQSTKASLATVINSMIYYNSFSGQVMSQIVIKTEWPLRNTGATCHSFYLKLLLYLNNAIHTQDISSFLKVISLNQRYHLPGGQSHFQLVVFKSFNQKEWLSLLVNQQFDHKKECCKHLQKI